MEGAAGSGERDKCDSSMSSGSSCCRCGPEALRGPIGLGQVWPGPRRTRRTHVPLLSRLEKKTKLEFCFLFTPLPSSPSLEDSMAECQIDDGRERSSAVARDPLGN